VEVIFIAGWVFAGLVIGWKLHAAKSRRRKEEETKSAQDGHQGPFPGREASGEPGSRSRPQTH
jgi:hypothetical protein